MHSSELRPPSQQKPTVKGLSNLTRRSQLGNPMTNLPSPEERMAMIELLHNVWNAIYEHKNNQVDVESIARLNSNTKDHAIIEVDA